MNIKTGQVLKWKNSTGERKVLAVLEQNTLLSHSDSFDKACGWYTFTEIEKYFDISKEKWWPKNGDEYFSFRDTGSVYPCDWANDSIDIMRHSIGNIFQTKKEAEEALEKIKSILKQ